MVCKRLRAVDIAPLLDLLPAVEFEDTGGSNGHVAYPEWLLPFAQGLDVGRVIRAVLRLLPPGQGIMAHIDHPHNSWSRGRRYHLPLVTHPLVTMRWPNDGVEEHLEAGWLYEVDHLRLHEVVNRAPVERVHLVVNAGVVP